MSTTHIRPYTYFLPSHSHGHVEAQAQVQAGVIQCLAEALLGFRAALKQAVQQALRAEHGIRIAAQVGHGVAEDVLSYGDNHGIV